MRVLSMGLLAGMIGFSASALADEPAVYHLTIKNFTFEPAELKVPAGKPFIIKVTNTGGIAEEFESTALKIEKVIARGSEATIRVRALDPGSYPFIGEYHAETAKGTIVAE